MEREELGTICFVDGDKISFNWNKKSGSIQFGELVAVPSLNTQTTFYARVYNRKSTTTVDKETQLREAELKEDVGPYSKYIEFDAVVFLENHANVLRTPSTNPDYHDKVYRMAEEDYETLKLGNTFQIGMLRSGTKLFGEVGIDIESIPHMIGIFGKIGSGKTNTELLLNAEIVANPKTVALMFDFAGELLEGKGIGKGLMNHPDFPTRINYYSLTSTHRLAIGLKTLYPSHLKIIFPDIKHPQIRLAERLLQKFEKSWVSQALQAYEEAGFQGVQELGVKDRKSVVDALLIKLLTLKHLGWEDSDYSFINQVVNDLSQGVSCLVDVSDIPRDVQRVFTIFAAKRAAEFWKTKWEKDHDYWKKLPTLLITLEEAHEFLHYPDPLHPPTFFAEIALRFRKYRVGVLPVTPRPCLLDPDVFAEIHTQFIMKTTMKRDRRFITENTPYLEYSDTEMKLLGKGEALLVADYPGGIPFAVPIKITHYPDYLKEQRPKNYNLPSSKPLDRMDETLKRIKEASIKMLKESPDEGRMKQ